MKLLSAFLLILLLISGKEIAGQVNGSASLGVGFPDLLNIGGKLQVSGQSEIGLNLGDWPPSKPGFLSWSNLVSVAGDFYYHFAG